MSKYFIKKIEIENLKGQLNESLIWAFHVDKVPPHVGISIDGLYYSMKVNEADIDLDVNAIFQVVQRKKIPTIVVKLRSADTVSQLKEIFKSYGPKIVEGDSCMTPVLTFLRQDKNLLLDDLILSLQEQNQVDEIIGVNLPDEFEGIPSYSHKEVQEHIYQLQHVKRR